MPAGVNLAWTSSNDDVATVDENGLVTAIGGGECVITASFDYEGQTYSDACSIEVASVPIDWEHVEYLTSQRIYDNSLYESYQYFAVDRKTAIEAVYGDTIVCRYDASGNVTSLYVDAKLTDNALPEPMDFEAYDYRVRIVGNPSAIPEGDSAGIEVSGTSNVANAIKINAVQMQLVGGEPPVEEFADVLDNGGTNRLVTLQVKNTSYPSSESAMFSVEVELQKKLKE